jgi:hypothetical protein
MTIDKVVDDIASRLITDIEGLSVDVKAYKWAAGPGDGLDSVPAAVVQIPRIERSGVDKNEDHIGASDLHLTFEVFFFFDASNVTFTMPQALETVAAFTDAIDEDIDLGATCQEAKVTSSDPINVDSEGGRPLFGYSCTVGVLAFF